MSHSEANRVCPRCGGRVDGRSAFAVHVWAEDDRLLYDVVFSKNTSVSGFMMHMSADRQCKGEISGYIGKLLRNLGLSIDCDTSELERL
jgi:hypothetical protein